MLKRLLKPYLNWGAVRRLAIAMAVGLLLAWVTTQLANDLLHWSICTSGAYPPLPRSRFHVYPDNLGALGWVGGVLGFWLAWTGRAVRLFRSRA